MKSIPVIDVVNQHGECPVDEQRIREAVHKVLLAEGITAGEVNVAIVDDATIQSLNLRHLGHDDPTDVISFPLERRGGYLEGEIVASLDTARKAAAELGWPAEDELLLYVVHGTLHLVGYDDLSDTDRARMRCCERRHLAEFGLEPPWDDTSR